MIRLIRRLFNRTRTTDSTEVDVVGLRLNGIATLLEGLGKRVALLEQATGGQWKTARGDTINIREMTDGHIRNCLRGGFARGPAKERMLRELERRAIEAQYRVDDLRDDLTTLGADLRTAEPDSNDGPEDGRWNYYGEA